MPRRKPSYSLVFLALALWLLGNWVGAHGHLCLDGQEPPLAMHMDVMGDHLAHHDDQPHVDTDLAPAKLAIAKIGKLDPGILLLAVVTLLLAFRPQSTFCSRYLLLLPRQLPHIRPPLRAPPVSA